MLVVSSLRTVRPPCARHVLEQVHKRDIEPPPPHMLDTTFEPLFHAVVLQWWQQCLRYIAWARVYQAVFDFVVIGVLVQDFPSECCTLGLTAWTFQEDKKHKGVHNYER